MLDEPLFELGFGILILEAKEFKHERIFDGFFGCNCIAGYGVSAFSSMAALFLESAMRS
jgi:hypothetical protein